MNTGIVVFIFILIFFLIPFALLLQLIVKECHRVMPALSQNKFKKQDYSWLKEMWHNS